MILLISASIFFIFYILKKQFIISIPLLYILFQYIMMIYFELQPQLLLLSNQKIKILI